MPSTTRSRLLQGFLISFTGAIFLSCKAIFVKLAFRHTHTDGLTLLALRMLLSLPFYLATTLLLLKREGKQKLSRKQWTSLILLGLTGYYLSSMFDFIGLQYISAGLERLILFLYPSFSVLINAFLFKQRISRPQYLALILTYGGTGIAYFGELSVDTSNPHFFGGSFLVFLCSLTYAIYLSGMGRMVRQISPTRFTTYSMLAATCGVWIHYLLHITLTGSTAWSQLMHTPTLWEYGIAIALIATVIPSFMISAGMKRIGPNNAAIVTSVGPVSTILQAHFFLGEPIFTLQIIGTALVITGVIIIGWKERKAE